MSKFHDFCGDVTASDTEDSSGHEETFRSPSLPADATDYNLSYATSVRKGKAKTPRRRSDSTTRSPSSRRTRSGGNSSGRRSNSSSGTPPQSASITTPRRGKSVENARARRLDISPSFDEPPAPRRTAYSQETTKSAQPPRRQEPQPKRTDTRSRKQLHPKKKSNAVLKEIYKLQHSTNLLIPKLPFSRLVREVLLEITNMSDIRVTPEFLFALQEASELYLVHFFQDAYLCTIHRGRVTLIPKDMQLALRLRGINDPGSCS